MKKIILSLALVGVMFGGVSFASAEEHYVTVSKMNQSRTQVALNFEQTIKDICDQEIAKNQVIGSSSSNSYTLSLESRVSSLESRFGALEVALDSVSNLMQRIGTLLSMLTLKK